MGLVEQAVYTSTGADGSTGYRVVAKSPGVSNADAAALAAWCPGEDALSGVGREVVSINFHPLPSGAYCVSRSSPAGWEYGGRGGMRIYTQCLIAGDDVLRQFANNPFSLLRAAMATGEVRLHARPPAVLSPIAVTSRPRAVDEALLGRLSGSVGGAAMARLVEAALDCECLAVTGAAPAGMLLSGVMSCLPVECRRDFSLSTAQKRSSRRPFRLIGLGSDPAVRDWTANQPHVTLLDLEAGGSDAVPIGGWGKLVERAFATGRFSFLAEALQQERPGLGVEDLPALGLQLIEELDAITLSEVGMAASEYPAEPPAWDDSPALRCAPAASGAAVATPAAPSTRLKPDSRAVLEKLERLDDLVYDAIAGRFGAIEELESAWPQTLSELGGALLHESREQYLRYALQIWDGKTADAGHTTERAVNAIEVLAILFDDA